MMEIIEVKHFSSAIYESVLLLNEILSPGIKTMDGEVLRSIIDSENNHLFLVSEKDVILGMLTVAIYTSPTGKKAWIEDVVIDTSRQGEGIGRRLVQYAIQFAKQLNVDQLMLTSKKKRIIANALYQALNFTSKETNVYEMKLK